MDIHLDYSIHPHSGLLNEHWKDDGDGFLELWDDKVKHCVKKIAPIFNRGVLFETGDTSCHGHPEPLQSERVNFSRSGIVKRTRPSAGNRWDSR
ncbi:MAG: 2OG-Fe(II) oxygenase, partial [Firmicutes bacterium]|nr:2OG-Fe(II) oxygenase [Bacillota bacterium]